MNPPHFPSSMPSSFLPSIPPSIPAYPKGVPVRSFHRPPPLATARDRLHFDSPFSPPLLDEGPEASDDDEMRNSTYSDHAYRSALTAPTTNSRKRSLATDDYDDEDRSAPPLYEEDRPAKRRIIDVVGSVASRVWEFCKARVPLYSSTPAQPAMTRDPDEHMYHPDMPAYLNGIQSPSYPPYEVGRVNAEQQQQQQHQQYQEQQGRYMPSPADFSAGGKHVVDGGLSSRWVMVSPAPTASTAPSSASSSSSRPAKRHVRPIIAASTRKRPVMRASHQRSRSSSTLASAPPQSSFTFSTASAASSLTSASPASRASRRKPRVEEDETDESIRRFQERLRDMIREGREALGSTVEVLYDDEYPI